MAHPPSSPAAILRPSNLSVVVLRTPNMQKMLDFYSNFLGASIPFQNEYYACLRFDSLHHRLALIAVPPTSTPAENSTQSTGLHHIGFSYPSLSALMAAYRHRKEHGGVLPFKCVDHGLVVSLYYCDPDANELEMQWGRFVDVEEADRYLMSEEFAKMGMGRELDPEELLADVKGSI